MKKLFLLLAVLLAGCGPSELEKAKTRLELKQAEYEELKEEVAELQRGVDSLPASEKLNASMKELRATASEKSKELQAAKDEVERLSN